MGAEPAQERSAVRAILPSVAVGLVLFAVLAAFVAADPTTGVTRSSSPFDDEGFNAVGAHNLALLGRLSTDEWTLWILELPFTLLLSVVFKLFGAGIVQARLTMILATAVTATLLGAGLTRSFGTRVATICAIGFATSLLTLYYGRLVYLEDLQVLALAAGVVSLAWLGSGPSPGSRRDVGLGIVAGACFAVAIGTKANGVFAVAGILAAVVLTDVRSAPTRRWLAGAAVVLVAAGVLWAVTVALPRMPAFEKDLKILAQFTWPQDVGTAFARAIGYSDPSGDQTLVLAAPLLIAAIAGLVVAGVRWRQMDPAARRLFGAGLGWFLVPFVVLLFASYRPNRYFYPNVAALAIMAAPAIAETLRVASRWGRATRAVAAIAIAAALAAQGASSYVGWMSHPTYELPAIQAQMSAAIRPGAVVVGNDVAEFFMSAPVVTVISPATDPSVNAGDLYRTFGARWYLVTKARPGRIAIDEPAAWAARREVACASWHGSVVCLYELP